jgi:hypothetical protein
MGSPVGFSGLPLLSQFICYSKFVLIKKRKLDKLRKERDLSSF